MVGGKSTDYIRIKSEESAAAKSGRVRRTLGGMGAFTPGKVKTNGITQGRRWKWKEFLSSV